MMLDVLIKYGVSEQSGEDAWKDLVLAVHHMTFVDAKTALKNVEQEWKDKFNRTLPAAYRSAKSVVLKAIRYDVALMNEAGKPMGKTGVERANREATTSPLSTTPSTADFVAALDKLHKLWENMEDGEEKDFCRTLPATKFL